MSRLSGLAVLVGPLDTAAFASGSVTAAVVSRLVAEGARVAVGVAPHGASASEELGTVGNGEVATWGHNVAAVDLDPADDATWRSAIDGALAAFGRLDAIVAAATVGDPSGHGLVQLLTDLSLDHLAATGGGAVVSLVADPAQPAAASASPELLRSAGSRGVRLNSIRLAAAHLDSEAVGVLFDGDQPRAVTPGDVAALAAFLLSDDSATCTGSVITLDAGVSF